MLGRQGEWCIIVAYGGDLWEGVYKREENVDVSDKGRVREVIGRERK